MMSGESVENIKHQDRSGDDTVHRRRVYGLLSMNCIGQCVMCSVSLVTMIYASRPSGQILDSLFLSGPASQALGLPFVTKTRHLLLRIETQETWSFRTLH